MCVYCVNKIVMDLFCSASILSVTQSTNHICNSITWDKMFGTWPSAHHYHGWCNCLFFIGPRYPAPNDQTNIGRHKKEGKPGGKNRPMTERSAILRGWPHQVCSHFRLIAETSWKSGWSRGDHHGNAERTYSKTSYQPKINHRKRPEIGIDAFNDNHVRHKLCTECACFISECKFLIIR